MLKGKLPYGALDAEIVAGWAVYETVDDRGMRGGIVAVARTKGIAQQMAKGKGWYGGDGEIEEAQVLCWRKGEVPMYFVVEAGQYVPALDTDLPKELRKRKEAALAKLTEEDIQILGLKKGT